ncbi:MAG: hypothetical protein XD95_0024 [Microgenomates bacterium 39_7]|nr:MAG: hypothetical protein XD95_0024 [Microgenomates bacterium 39_7]
MEETSQMVFDPEEEKQSSNVENLLIFLQDTRFSAEILDKIYNCFQQGKLKEAVALIRQIMNSDQPQPNQVKQPVA